MDNNFNKFAPKGRTKLVTGGSIISPELSGLRLVVVPCSMIGKPDSILHSIVDKKWNIINKTLKGWFSHFVDFKLGNIHSTAIQSDTWAIHMLCYDGKNNVNSLAVESCMKKISSLAVAEKASVHFSAPLLELIPSLGELTEQYLLNKGIHTYFYEEAAMSEAMQLAMTNEATKAEEAATVREMLNKTTSPSSKTTKSKTSRKSIKKNKKSVKKVAKKSLQEPTSVAIVESTSAVHSEIINSLDLDSLKLDIFKE